MQTFTDTVEVLYLTGEADSDGVLTSIAGDDLAVSAIPLEREELLFHHSADCVLLSDSLGTERAGRLVQRVRRERQSVSVVAFAGNDSRAAEALFDAGATEVIQSTSTEASPSLVRRRIEAALAVPTSAMDGTLAQLRQLDCRTDLFRQVTENISDVVWVNSLDNGGLEYVNSAYEEVWGRPRDRLQEDREALLETIHPDDREQVRDAMDSQLDRPESYDVTYRVVRPDETIRWVHSRAFGVREGGTLERIVGIATDITERKRREQQLEEQRNELAQLDHINRIIRGVDEALLGAQTRGEIVQAVCDRLAAAERYRYAVALSSVGETRLEPTAWTDGAEAFVDELFPVELSSREDVLGKRALATTETQVFQCIDASTAITDRWCETFRNAGVRSLAVIPVTYHGTTYGVIAVYSPQRNVFCEREMAVLDELGGTVGHAIAAVESREREQTLTSLYRATEGLLAAETPQAVGDVVVDTAEAVLDLSGIGLFLFDDETNLLSPVAATEAFLDIFGETRVFGPGKKDSITWHTYVTGEPQCFADVRESDRLANPETSARGSLVLPLGEHGVFVAASTEVGIFDEQKRRLVGLLAATAEATLDRVAGQADIRERDEELEARDRRLERLERLLSFVEDVNCLLRRADTRSELEQELCDRLVERECISFAWVGHVPPGSDELDPRTWAGAEEGYFDAVALDLAGDEPAVRAASAGETTTISNVTARLHDGRWAREALDRGYQSVLAVPLTDGETTYGVLAAYATEPATFADVVAETATELGSTVAHGINSVETRRGILSERATELEVHIDGHDAFLNAVSDVAGEPVHYQEITPVGDRTTKILFALSDPPVEEILGLESSFVAVDSLTSTPRGENHLFRVTVSGQTVADELLDCGAVPRQVSATASGTQATVRLPKELDVCEFLDRFRSRYPGTEVRSRRDVDRLGETATTAHFELDDLLTVRQREVLVTAYESGFFQSPRETTGEELAALLGVSQPTVTHHLREAQRRLLAALLDPE